MSGTYYADTVTISGSGSKTSLELEPVSTGGVRYTSSCYEVIFNKTETVQYRTIHVEKAHYRGRYLDTKTYMFSDGEHFSETHTTYPDDGVYYSRKSSEEGWYVYKGVIYD